MANDIAATVYWSIMDSVVDNCMGECNNNCLREHDKNAYCDFCSFATEKLPCPKNRNISYDTIKASEKDMIH